MARNSKMNKADRNIKKIASGISGSMDALYRSTYMSTPQQNNDLKDLNSRINASIDNIINKNMDTIGIPSVSKLYSRISSTNKDSKDLMQSLESMFDSGLITDDLYGVFMSNRYLKELDNEIDTVCKYMPKLEEALAVQKDSVLSADHFSKDFLTFAYPGSGATETVFSERVKDIKRKYDLAQLVDEIYEDTSRYGEKFIYRVPYSLAIGKLLAAKPDTNLVFPTRGMHESSSLEANNHEHFLLNMTNSKLNIYDESKSSIQESSASILTESSTIKSGKQVTQQILTPILQERESFNIGIEICRSGIIESVIEDAKMAYEKKCKIHESSLWSMHEQAISHNKHNTITEDTNKAMEAKGNIDWKNNPLDSRMIANDGLIGADGSDTKPVKVNAPGCVVTKLNREQVVPIYIDDLCMGYYYFELKTTNDSESFMGFKNILNDPLTNMKAENRSSFNNVDTQRQDETIKYVAGQLSKFIDKKFVNSNQDLAKEIYMILKYNDLFNTPSIDLIKVTFIPPEDMVHFYFRLDPVTHRGISDLERALVPAKIYSSLYITSAIGNLTRGQDKRVYYVKQTVDTNIAQTLLNTISQIKQSNFGIRQFQNINNVLNITGRYNDYVIPTNASGDPPIQFEVMPGQDIKTPTELMEQLEEMAINSTGVPLEIIQARQSVDYAMQLTMSSSKFLRFCYKRQELFQKDLSDLISPIYNYEYEDSVTIDITLPPPSFINITNTNQLVDNTKGFVQSITEIELADVEDEKLRQVYTRELFKHYVGSHLDISTHQNIMDRAKIIAKQTTDESHSDGGQSDY